ncbi:hypothetical protein RJ639_011973 [Escallonia herrerae]|uniref:DUF7910 domain-containing protein n=1 Tax=Escallonia herrerae TaxID=1293975 RepID=A0AA88VV80_9ASTE|nr:hypothetical protein RJ639_011973 [Escallonia herrerae]
MEKKTKGAASVITFKNRRLERGSTRSGLQRRTKRCNGTKYERLKRMMGGVEENDGSFGSVGFRRLSQNGSNFENQHKKNQDAEFSYEKQSHWSTYITEDDFRFMSENGINAVRIPVGWWIKYDPTPPKPFVGGSLQALDNAFIWEPGRRAAPCGVCGDSVLTKSSETIAGEWTAEWGVKNAGMGDYQRFAKAQIDVYGKATFGWAYWSYKNVNPHWSLRINECSFKLRVFNKQFVGLKNQGKGSNVVVASNAADAAEVFQIVRKPDDPNRVRLKASNGLFLQAATASSVTAEYGGSSDWRNKNPSVFTMHIEETLEGEFQVTNGYGPKKAPRIMRNHWSTFITEDDFRFMSEYGINAVRIPVGWWIKYDPTPPKPFVGVSCKL